MRGDALRACLFSFDDSVKIVFDLTNAAPLSEFVPFALGWYGDMGEAATSFIRTRIITRLVIYNSSYVFVVHRDRFFSSRFSHVAKYCNASWVFASSSSRAAASTTRFFRAPSFLVVKSYHQWPT